MGFRDTMRRLFGASEEVDPDEPTEIGVVPLAMGPISVSKLCQEGFDATGIDAFNIITNVITGQRIFVPQHQSEAAVVKLEEILARSR